MDRGASRWWALVPAVTAIFIAGATIVTSGCGGAPLVDVFTTTGTTSTSTTGTSSTGTSSTGTTGSTSTGGTNAGSGCTVNDYVPNYVETMLVSDTTKPRLLWWAKFPLRVLWVRSGLWTPEREASVKVGFQRWVTKADTMLPSTPGPDFVDAISDADADWDLKVEFVDQSTLGGLRLGLTTVTYFVDTREIVTATMQIAVTDVQGNPFTDLAYQAVGGHELGHALGIQGHSPYSDDQMFSTYNGSNQTTVTDQDANTLFTAYCATFNRGRGEGSGRRKYDPSKVDTIQIE